MNIETYREKSTFSLEPKELGNVDKYVRSRVYELIGRSNVKGCIIDIPRIFSIKPHLISRTSYFVYFEAEYEIILMKPKTNDIYNVLIKDILREGIITSFKQIQVLIPIVELRDWVMSMGVWRSLKGNKTIEVGETIEVQITAVEYVMGEYQCLGKPI